MTEIYKILPFQFKRTKENEVLLVNECGDFIFLENKIFLDFVNHNLSTDSAFFLNLNPIFF